MSAEWVGKVIDNRYEVLALLGEGSMGLVLRARHRLTHGGVAIKVLHSHLRVQPELVERFLAEAKAPARIRHPGIAGVTDAGVTSDGDPYFVMELLEGEVLAEIVLRGPMPLRAVREIGLGVLDALGAAHEAGFVHRDLKPENVFIAASGAPKLLDFGVAKVLDKLTGTGGSAKKGTLAGAIFGTLGYMAPEQLRNSKDVDARADLWAAGVMLYEMISGRLPYEAEEVYDMIVAMETQEPCPLSSRLQQVPPEVEAFFARALARNRDDRFASAAEMQGALLALPIATLVRSLRPGPRPASGPPAGPESAARTLPSGPPGAQASGSPGAGPAPPAPVSKKRSLAMDDDGNLPAEPLSSGPSGSFVPLELVEVRPVSRPGEHLEKRNQRLPDRTREPALVRRRSAPPRPWGALIVAVLAIAGGTFVYLERHERAAPLFEYVEALLRSAPIKGAVAPPAPASAVPTGSNAITAAAPAASASAGAAKPAVSLLGYRCPDGMAFLGGGDYWMGSDAPPGSPDERPRHLVTLDDFCLDAKEVTNADYRTCAKDAAKCTPLDGKTAGCNGGKADRDDHPANCVTFRQAEAYCAAAGKRLPTEAQWEIAARGAEERPFPWGDAAPGIQACWDGEGSDLGKGRRTGTCPTGSHGAGSTPEGVQDLAGNVAEWTSSPYCTSYGKSRCTPNRVVRGGAWDSGDGLLLRGTRRTQRAPLERSKSVGFRCARLPSK